MTFCFWFVLRFKHCIFSYFPFFYFYFLFLYFCIFAFLHFCIFPPISAVKKIYFNNRAGYFFTFFQEVGKNYYEWFIFCQVIHIGRAFCKEQINFAYSLNILGIFILFWKEKKHLIFFCGGGSTNICCFYTLPVLKWLEIDDSNNPPVESIPP